MKGLKKTGKMMVCLLLMTSCASIKKKQHVLRDGSSFENAIVVNRISECYRYTSNTCVDCQIKEQLLVFNDNRPYTLFKLKNKNGEVRSYYFDISKMY
jgi:hypothetical protein